MMTVSFLDISQARDLTFGCTLQAYALVLFAAQLVPEPLVGLVGLVGLPLRKVKMGAMPVDQENKLTRLSHAISHVTQTRYFKLI